MLHISFSLSAIHSLLEALVEKYHSPIPPSTSLDVLPLHNSSEKDLPPVIRPPWSQAEQEFRKYCDGCSACIAACERRILLKGNDGFPVVNFSQGECTFCGDCVSVCQRGALVRSDPHALPWKLAISITPACLASNKTICRTCGEQCAKNAITFNVKPGGVTESHIASERCNGCGACFSICPVGAIRIAKTAD